MFDASARNSQGVSLNSNLLAGPKTQLQIPYLMTHLRMNPIVLIGDISRMFYALKYQKTPSNKGLLVEDLRDLYRFLWNEEDSKLAPQAYRVLAMLQGASDSPYISAATIHKHLDDVIAKADDPDTIKAAELIKLRLYIDDLVLSLG